MLQLPLHDHKTIDQSRCRDDARRGGRGLRAVRGGPDRHGLSVELEHRSDYLRFPAPVNYTRCTRRYIRLNGRYWWTLYYEHWAHPEAPEEVDRPAPVYLRGRYRWLDCLHYHRSSSGTTPFYRHRSWIRNERTGGEVLYQQDLWYWGIQDIAGDGSYDWGSRLFHRRPRRR